MNKKVLSAILFSALFAGTGTFTSCIDNDEPAGIENLRGAKAELIRAKVAVEAANATYKLAEAEVQKAEAARLNAIAAIEKANAEYQELLNERQSITNAEAQADLDAKIEKAKQTAAEAALRHQKTILDLQTKLANAQREYEITMKQIEIAKALMNEGELQTIEQLEGIVETKQGAVSNAMSAVKKAEVLVYNAAMNLDKDNAYWTAKYALDLKYAEEVLAGAQGDVEKYKNFLENLKYADWYQEIQDIKVELDSLNEEKIALDVAKEREYNSDEHLALVEAHKAAVAAKAEIKAPKVAEDLTYAYKYFAGSQEVEGKIAKGGLMSDAIEALTGEDKTIDQLNAEIASYTEEYKAFLKALAADEDLEDADKKKADYEAAVKTWKEAKTTYADKVANTKNLSYQTAIDAHKAFNTAMTEAAGNETKEVKAKQAFADALVAWYNTLPADQVSFNNLTLEITSTVMGTTKTEYVTKNVKEFLSDASNKDIYLIELAKQCFVDANGVNNQWTYFWSEAAQVTKEVTLSDGTKKNVQTSKAVFGKWIADKNAVINKAAKALVDASKAAFGDAKYYINLSDATKVKVDGVDTAYLTVEPSESDVKRIANYATVAGAYGEYLAYTDKGVIFVAKNLDAILADLKAAKEFWAAAAEEMTEAVEAYVAEIEAADAAITAAWTAFEEAGAAIETKYAAAEEVLGHRAFVLNNIKNKLEEYVTVEGYDATAYDTVEKWLAAEVKEAEYALIAKEAEVLSIEQAIKQMEDGMHASSIALKDAELTLEKATEKLEKAQAELAEALANLETAIAIMSAE